MNQAWYSRREMLLEIRRLRVQYVLLSIVLAISTFCLGIFIGLMV